MILNNIYSNSRRDKLGKFAIRVCWDPLREKRLTAGRRCFDTTVATSVTGFFLRSTTLASHASASFSLVVRPVSITRDSPPPCGAWSRPTCHRLMASLFMFSSRIVPGIHEIRH